MVDILPVAFEIEILSECPGPARLGQVAIQDTSNIEEQINSISNSLDNLDLTINTLQQQIQSEGFACGAGSTDPECNQPLNLIREGGFKPLPSTTPNIPSTTLVFTSPRSVELLQQKLSVNPNVPKKVLLKIVDDPQSEDNGVQPGAHRPPRNLNNNVSNNRLRFGTRLAHNAQRFASLFGNRKRREAPEQAEIIEMETVNMIKGFQVVSAADLNFDTRSLQQGGAGLDSTFDLEQVRQDRPIRELGRSTRESS